mgnify:CR=1 FL=1
MFVHTHALQRTHRIGSRGAAPLLAGGALALLTLVTATPVPSATAVTAIVAVTTFESVPAGACTRNFTTHQPPILNLSPSTRWSPFPSARVTRDVARARYSSCRRRCCGSAHAGLRCGIDAPLEAVAGNP